jgi:hypothetical protein
MQMDLADVELHGGYGAWGDTEVMLCPLAYQPGGVSSVSLLS